MRERYGVWAAKVLAVFLVLLAFGTSYAQPQPKLYPTLSVQNTQYNGGTEIIVPAPGAGEERLFLVPVFVKNEVDPIYNPNIGGQFLEPIRSFEFDLSYFTQAMVLDTNATHGPAVLTVGPGVQSAAEFGLARHFRIFYNDRPDPRTGQTDENPFRRTVRVTAASEVPLPIASNYKPLVWLRFKVIPTAVNLSQLQLDSSLFNDHRGDPQVDPINYQRGNFGSEVGSKGSGIVRISPQPSFEFRPQSLIAQTNATNYTLIPDLIIDPTIPNAPNPTIGIQIRNGTGLSRLTNINICTNQPFLSVSTPNPGGGQQCVYIPSIDNGLAVIGSEEKQLFITANAAGLQPGIYYGTVTFTSPGASNSPSKLLVRVVVRRSPDEPTIGGTGVRLRLTNSCVPKCEKTITFGTGPGATAGIDPLYGEAIYTFDDSVATASQFGADACAAYFVPLDRNADAQFQDPNFLGTLRDIRSNKSDSTLIYLVRFHAGTPSCYPMTVCVDPADFPAGARLVARVILNGVTTSYDLRNSTQNGSERCFTITDSRINQFYIEYTPGQIGVVPTLFKNNWNLISLPVIPPDPRASVIFENTSAGTPFKYRANEGWTPSVDLEFGRGYMLKFGNLNGTQFNIAGVRSKVVNNIRIDQGWNSVGTISVPTTDAGIQLTPLAGSGTAPVLETEVFEFVPSGGYRTASYLIPGRGYFIKSSSEGYYNLKETGGKQNVSNEILTSQLAKVTVSDAADNSQSLYFGETAMNVNDSRFEMPPSISDLDARFAENHGMVSLNKDNYTINLRSANFPVSLSFANTAGVVEVRDMQGNLIGTNEGGNAVKIASKSTQQVVVSYKGGNSVAASGFALGQNYPNPLSAASATSFNYSVPAETFVVIELHNQLGELVQTLVSGVVKAGSYDVSIDASNLASGTYFYSIHAGNFSKTMKMTVNK